jgi:hypothetical protein
MRWSFSLVGLVGLGLALPSSAAPPAPSPAPPVAPWANKFFVPEIATHREQAPPPVITHSFGDVAHGTLCAHTFKITNIYDVPMQITEVRKSCSCLDFVPMTRVLQPNETGDFTVTMNSAKFVGTNSQKLYVTFGPKFISTAVIQLSANSRTEVTVNPGAVAFGTVAPGSKPSQSVKVEYKGRSRDWKITEVLASPQTFDVQVTETNRGGPIRGGCEYLVTVSLKSLPAAGAITEQVALKTNDPNNPLIQLPVTASVASQLALAPDKVRIDRVAIGESASTQILVRAAKPFRITGVDGTGDGVTVELPSTRTPLPVQRLTVKFDPAKAGATARQLLIKTDLDGGATVVLPVEAEAGK